MALTGRTVLLVLLGAVPLVIWPGRAVQLGWLALVAVAVVVDLLLAGSPRELRLERSGPPSVRAGEPVDATLVVTNTGRRRVRGLLRDAWQPSAGAVSSRHRVDVPGGERRRLVTRLVPTRRGDRLVERVTVRSYGPLGVAARQRSLTAPGRVRVLPPFTSRRHLPSKLARLREIDGRTALRVRGQGTEFDSLRDYVVGDDVRSIDWRASARRQQVVVRTWRPERDRRVLLLLDTSRTAAARVVDAPRLDAAMDAALLLAALATRAGDRVDLLAMDRRVRARVEGVSGAKLLPALVEAMAPLEAAAVEEGLLPVITRLTSHHQVVIASVSDPDLTRMARGRADVDEVYAAAAAERAALDRAATTAELTRLGVDVVDADPADLPPRLADRYLALKAAGRL